MTTNPTILYVEDEAGIRKQLSRFLNYFSEKLFVAEDGKEGLDLYKKHLPDIIVTDIKMPHMDGIEMAKAIKTINPKQHIIFTTAHSEINYFLDAIDIQVDGYIMKPIDLDELEGKLKEKLEKIKEDINLRKLYKKQQKALEQRVYIDELTKIPNRAYFEKEFNKEISRRNREKTSLSLIIFDIDKFKDFNDNYGHQKGDDALKELAKIIKNDIRQTDIFARWGGEEFVCILVNTPINNAEQIAQKLRSSIQDHIFNDSLKITASFGVSEWLDGDTKESIIKRADDALYKAKRNGRNRVETQLENT